MLRHLTRLVGPSIKPLVRHTKQPSLTSLPNRFRVSTAASTTTTTSRQWLSRTIYRPQQQQQQYIRPMSSSNETTKTNTNLLRIGINDTIYSIASGVGHYKSPVVVYRISGPRALDIARILVSKPCRSTTSTNRLESIHEPERHTSLKPRVATLRKLYHPTTGEHLDSGLLLFFPGPASFTGEDVLEIHGHGGRATVNRMLSTLQSLSNNGDIRLAEPGEFSRRAFLNDKMDITEAEGLMDLINAQTEYQRVQALAIYSGRLKELYEGWRTSLVLSMANIEALIDFGDDEVIDEDHVLGRANDLVLQLISTIREHLCDARRGEKMRSGANLAIVGLPNAGKSRLMNHLADRKVAIVSAVPGTTRDVVEITLDIGGYPVLLADTAGLRITNDEIELEGISLAIERGKNADIKLCVVDAATSHDCDLTEQWSHMIDRSTIVVFNKMDIVAGDTWQQRVDLIRDRYKHIEQQAGAVAFVSCATGEGLSGLLDLMQRHVASLFHSGATNESAEKEATALLTRHRHRRHLEECYEMLMVYRDMPSPKRLEVAAEYLRRAALALGKITGRTGVEDVLDVVFKEFCIGK